MSSDNQDNKDRIDNLYTPEPPLSEREIKFQQAFNKVFPKFKGTHTKLSTENLQEYVEEQITSASSPADIDDVGLLLSLHETDSAFKGGPNNRYRDKSGDLLSGVMVDGMRRLHLHRGLPHKMNEPAVKDHSDGVEKTDRLLEGMEFSTTEVEGNYDGMDVVNLPTTDEDGTVTYTYKDQVMKREAGGTTYFTPFNDDRLHRDAGPAAIIYDNGKWLRSEWHQYGTLHREDGPALVYADGREGWYQFGKPHREGGPAFLSVQGDKEWWHHGERDGAPSYKDGAIAYHLMEKLHRIGAPASIGDEGSLSWYQNGRLHRTDGPAVVRINGQEEWWQNGKLHRDEGPALTSLEGTESWYKKGKKHRVRGPAVIHKNGSFAWHFEGQLHRVGGPAVKDKDGCTFWYKHGQFHREDGPAVIWKANSNWYLNGELHRLGGPAVEGLGGYRWYKHGKLHREDGPAVEKGNHWYFEGVARDDVKLEDVHVTEEEDGTKTWYNRLGLRHRVGKPAVHYANGDTEYFYDGKLHCSDGPAAVYDGVEYWFFHGIPDVRNPNVPPDMAATSPSSSGTRFNLLRASEETADYQITEERDGDVSHYRSGVIDSPSDDKPAFVGKDGLNAWYLFGRLHRGEGPALINADGDEEFWINGIKRCPPVTIETRLIDGSIEFHCEGKLHRTDGPAIIKPDGREVWILKGTRHREGGPAVTWPSGEKEWWIHGVRQDSYVGEDDPYTGEVADTSPSSLFTPEEAAEMALAITQSVGKPDAMKRLISALQQLGEEE